MFTAVIRRPHSFWSNLGLFCIFGAVSELSTAALGSARKNMRVGGLTTIDSSPLVAFVNGNGPDKRTKTAVNKGRAPFPIIPGLSPIRTLTRQTHLYTAVYPGGNQCEKAVVYSTAVDTAGRRFLVLSLCAFVLFLLFSLSCFYFDPHLLSVSIVSLWC